jgi:hypothetical protein
MNTETSMLNAYRNGRRDARNGQGQLVPVDYAMNPDTRDAYIAGYRRGEQETAQAAYGR